METDEHRDRVAAPAGGRSSARIRRPAEVRFAHGDPTCAGNLGLALLTMALMALPAGPASALDIGPGTDAQPQSALEQSGPKQEQEQAAVRPMRGERASAAAKTGRSIGRRLPARIDGTAYTWRDGPRARTAILQPNLTVQRAAAASGPDGRDRPAYSIVARVGAQDGALPVFRSAAGDLMMLPGGVILVLDPDWSEAAADDFLAARGIDRRDVDVLRWARNAFFVPTEPGFAALDLANALAAEAGVVLASPNWWTEAALK